MYIIFVLESCILGAAFARIDGGGLLRMNEWIERLLCMSFFVLACVPTAGLWSLLALLGMFGIATGHGQYFLAMLKEKLDPEWFDFIVEYFYGKDPRTAEDYVDGTPYEDETKLYHRCVFGMFVTGTIVGLPAAVICIATGNLYGILLLLTGLAKAGSYHIWHLLTGKTEHAEASNGFTRTLLAMLALTKGL